MQDMPQPEQPVIKGKFARAPYSQKIGGRSAKDFLSDDAGLGLWKFGGPKRLFDFTAHVPLHFTGTPAQPQNGCGPSPETAARSDRRRFERNQ